MVMVQDRDYLGWANGTVVNMDDVFVEYKLSVNENVTTCLRRNSSEEELETAIQQVLRIGANGGLVRVRKAVSEYDAPNGFIYFLTFYDTGDLPPIIPVYSNEDDICPHPFRLNQHVIVQSLSDGSIGRGLCENCVHGVVQRGNITIVMLDSPPINGSLVWNAAPAVVQRHLEQAQGWFVKVER